MDTETSEVIQRVNARIDALEVTLRAEIRGESTILRREMSSMRDDLRAEFRNGLTGLADGVDGLVGGLNSLAEGLAENRRHTEIQIEGVRDDIRILAEGFAVISTKLDSLQR